MALVRSQLAHTRYGPVEYSDFGAGPAVLLLHGGMGGYDMGLAWGNRLVDRFRVICVSRAGYLRTPLSTGASLEEQADVLVAFLDVLELASTSIFAHSAGAPTATTLAGRYPDRVWALVMESAISQDYSMAQPKLTKPLWMRDCRQRVKLLYMGLRPRPYLQAFLRSVSSLDQSQLDGLSSRILRDRERYRFFLAVQQATHPTRYRWAGRQNDCRNLRCLQGLPYKSIRAPTLVCHGRQDADVALSHAEWTVRSICNSQMLVSNNGGHLLPLADDCRELLAHQKEFLSAHNPR